MLALVVIATVWRAWVLTVLWTWFVVPIAAVAVLTVPAAVGVITVFASLTYHLQPTSDREGRTWQQAMNQVFVVPAMSLTMGWIVTLFM